MFRTRSIAAVAALSFVTGCATWSVETECGEKYPIYAPKPYLQVLRVKDKEAEKEKVEAQIVYLPDTSKTYHIDTTTILAKSNFEFTLTHGWRLDAINAEADTSAVAVALLEAVGNAIPTKALTEGDDKEGVEVELYELEFNKKTGAVTGLVGPIKPGPRPSGKAAGNSGGNSSGDSN